MRTQGIRLSMAFSVILLNALPAASLAGEGMIMMSGDCPYMVLDTTEGQALIKRVTGATPETGDILEGNFYPKEFSILTNRRTDETLKVWVDIVDPYSNRALSRHGNFCS